MGGRSSSFRSRSSSGGIKMGGSDTLDDLWSRVIGKRQEAIDTSTKIEKAYAKEYYSKNPDSAKLTRLQAKGNKYYDDVRSLEKISNHLLNLSRSAGDKATISSIRNSNSIPDRLSLNEVTQGLNEWNKNHK